MNESSRKSRGGHSTFFLVDVCHAGFKMYRVGYRERIFLENGGLGNENLEKLGLEN